MPETFDVVIYHNPECGTSRNTLAMMRQSGEEPHVIEYLKTPPTRDQLVELLQQHHLTQVLYNLPAGDWAKGDRGIGCLPDRVGEFQDGVSADKLPAHRMNIAKNTTAVLPIDLTPSFISTGSRSPENHTES